MLAALRSSAYRLVTAPIWAVLLVVTLLYVRDLFETLFCGAVSVTLPAMARSLSHSANDLALRVI